jgi:hypothetical protein
MFVCSHVSAFCSRCSKNGILAVGPEPLAAMPLVAMLEPPPQPGRKAAKTKAVTAVAEVHLNMPSKML